MDYNGLPCSKCGEIIKVYSLSGLCRDCYHSRKAKVRHCDKCDNQISLQSQSGLCLDCRIANKKKDLNKYHIVSVKGKSIAEHRYIWEKANNKKIPHGWVIHHLNGLKGDNRLENLLAMPKHCHNGHLVEDALKLRILQLEKELNNLRRGS